NYGPLAGGDTLARLARLAEDRGADGVWVSDHLVAPVGATSEYPYGPRRTPASTQLGIIEEFYEPLVTLAFLAGQTRPPPDAAGPAGRERVRDAVPESRRDGQADRDARRAVRRSRRAGRRRRVAPGGVRRTRRAVRAARPAHGRLPRGVPRALGRRRRDVR